MPSDAPAIKVGNVKAMGATVIPFDRFGQDRMALVAPYVERGMTLVPPYDDPAIIAGQGQSGLNCWPKLGRSALPLMRLSCRAAAAA